MVIPILGDSAMHILVLLLTVLGGAAFWYYRLKNVSKAGAEVIDHVGRARGKYRRNQRRKLAAQSPVAAIDSPLIAASTLLYTLMETHPTTPAQDEEVTRLLADKAGASEIEEAVVYGKWVQGQNVPENKAMPMLCEKLLDWLNDNELEDFEKLVAELDASPMFNLSERRLAMMNKRLRTQ